MKLLILVLLVFALFLTVSADTYSYDENVELLNLLEKNQEAEDEEAEEESVTTSGGDYEGHVPVGSQPTVKKDLGRTSLSVIAGYVIAGIVGVILLLSVIVGSIVGIATLSASPVKYNEIFILNSNKSEKHEALLDHVKDDEVITVVDVEKKQE